MKTIDIRGTNTRNKGAHLMLLAICGRLGDRADLTAPTPYSDFSVRAAMGLQQTLYLPQLPRSSAALGRRIPSRLRRDYGLIANCEIDGVVDASGFHYTDQFAPKLPKREALIGRTWDRRSVPKVVLPQAFGPFDNSKVRRWTEEALNQAEVVFVRDSVSAGHLRKLKLDVRVIQAPDFTIELHPDKIPPVVPGEFLAIVPNTKMVTHGGQSTASYLKVLLDFANAGVATGLRPVFVVHEASDNDLAQRAADQCGGEVFADSDPMVLKAALSQASASVASRFHAVVSSLSQHVPTLAFGWSHKYGELLKDFDVPGWRVDPNRTAIEQLSSLLADAPSIERQRDALPRLQEKVDAMWDIAIDALGLV